MTKILFIEDDRDQIFLFKKRFELEQIDLIAAENSAEADQKILAEKPDLILLDILLGRENGLDILEKLKKKPKTQKIPIVVFTNYEKKEVRNRAQSLSANDFLLKIETTPDQLINRVKAVLAGKNPNWTAK